MKRDQERPQESKNRLESIRKGGGDQEEKKKKGMVCMKRERTTEKRTLNKKLVELIIRALVRASGNI